MQSFYIKKIVQEIKNSYAFGNKIMKIVMSILLAVVTHFSPFDHIGECINIIKRLSLTA